MVKHISQYQEHDFPESLLSIKSKRTYQFYTDNDPLWTNDYDSEGEVITLNENLGTILEYQESTNDCSEFRMFSSQLPVRGYGFSNINPSNGDYLHYDQGALDSNDQLSFMSTKSCQISHEKTNFLENSNSQISAQWPHSTFTNQFGKASEAPQETDSCQEQRRKQ